MTAFFHSLLPHDEGEEAKLFRAFRAGDAGAFKRLFDMHHPPLYLLVLGVLDDAQAASRIVSAAFEKLLIDREKIADAGQLSRYLYAEARNGAIVHLGKEPSEALIIHSKLLERFAKNIQRLPRRRKKIFLLHYFLGEEISTISLHYKIRERATEFQLLKAVATLRTALSFGHYARNKPAVRAREVNAQ